MNLQVGATSGHCQGPPNTRSEPAAMTGRSRVEGFNGTSAQHEQSTASRAEFEDREQRHTSAGATRIQLKPMSRISLA